MANKLAFAGSSSKYQEPDAEPAGFWPGVWHGMMMPVAFIMSLFNPGVGIYETHNNGKLYNLGFVIGASMAFGGGKKGIEINLDDSKSKDDEDVEDGEES